MVQSVTPQSNYAWFDASNNKQPISKEVSEKLQKAGIREGEDGSFYDKDGKRIMGPDGKTPATVQEVSKYVDDGTVSQHVGTETFMDPSPPPVPTDAQHSVGYKVPISN